MPTLYNLFITLFPPQFWPEPPGQTDLPSTVWFSPALSVLGLAAAPIAPWWSVLKKWIHDYFVLRRFRLFLSCCLPHLPRSPLRRASARAGFRSFSNDNSCGFASSISRSKAGLSSPWEVEAEVAWGGRDGVALGRGACCCLFWPDELPGMAMELKSMRGRPRRSLLLMARYVLLSHG